ncbi:linear amide C-N hydrolase [Usitatibacter palustris]|nr:linear amide C-N hydrolase [Usitatibacter palustris]
MRAIIAAFLLLAALPAAACTTFCLKDASGLVFGRNYDYDFGDALVLVNARGVAKTSLLDGNPARWVSAYGSVTFNQYGKDSPSGGVNEKGLVVEMMMLDDTRFPPPDKRPVVGALEFIQYLLDNAGDVEDAVVQAGQVRIATRTPVHFLLADRAGHAAAIEFLRERMVVRRGDTLPDCALANSTYPQSQAYASKSPVSLDVMPRGEAGSLERYARAARAVRTTKAPSVEKSFAILDDVVQNNTHWQIVYDLPRATIHYRTAANRAVRTLDLARMDFACRHGGRMLDVDAGRGDVTHALLPYAPEANERQMLVAFAKSPHFAMPAHLVRAEAAQVETRRCVAAG